MARKRSRTKRSSARKRPARKAATKRRVRGKATKRSSAKRSSSKSASLKRRARKGIQAAKGGIDTVRQAGERTWEVLKSTTAQVVEGVKDRMSESPQP
jgi:hypothetical protein